MPGQNTFPRAVRLTRKSDFTHVFRDGAKVVGRAFICYLAWRDGRGSRLGIAVSRKVGGAVVRNGVKRGIREYFRTQRHRFVRDADLVVVARPGSAGLSCQACAEALERLLKRGGVLDG